MPISATGIFILRKGRIGDYTFPVLKEVGEQIKRLGGTVCDQYLSGETA
jgi:hypothetical protein